MGGRFYGRSEDPADARSDARHDRARIVDPRSVEPISDEELLMWRVLRQYEALVLIAEKIVAADLADAIKLYRDVKPVSPIV